MCVLLLAFCRGMFFVSNVHTVGLAQDFSPVSVQLHENLLVQLEIPVSRSLLDGQYWYVFVLCVYSTCCQSPCPFLPTRCSLLLQGS